MPASKQKKRLPQNGIDINNAPQQQKQSTIIAAVFSQVLLILFAVFGVTYSVIGSFHLNVHSVTIGAYILLFTLIFVAAFAVKKWTKFIMPPVLLLFGLAFWCFYHDIIQGFILATNDVLATFTEHSDWIFNVYDVEVATTVQYAKMETVFVVFIVFTITGVVSNSIIRANQKCFFPVFFITFPFIFAALFFTITPPLLPLLLLFICWVTLAVQQISSHKIKKRKKSGKRTDISESSINKTAYQLNYFSIAAVALCFALLLCIFPQSSYVRDPNATNTRDKLKNFVQDSALLSAWQTGGMNGGNLKNSGDLSFTGETALRVKTDNKSSMYLRGFAGSTYTGDRWEPISDQLYNSKSTAFNTLNGKTFHPLNMTAKSIEIIGSRDASAGIDSPASLRMNPQFNITVQNVHTDRHYIYSPYSLITTPNEIQGMVPVNDEYLKADSWFGVNNYSLKAYSLQPSDNRINLSLSAGMPLGDYYKFDTRKQGQSAVFKQIPWAQDYFNAEYAYRCYIYDTNTTLPADIKKKLVKLCEENQLYKDTLNKEISAVQAYLAKYYKYTLSPGKTPANQDFADYFLFKNRKGYCVHFATAATVLLRAMGIPARYVEGYVANQNDLTTLDSDGYANIIDSRAHAWTEVYIPQYGWVPVEMTPGFYTSGKSNLSARAGEQPTVTPQPTSSTHSTPTKSEASNVSQLVSSSMPESSTPSSPSTGIIGGNDSTTNILISDLAAALLPVLFMLFLLFTLMAILYGSRKYAIRWRKRNFHLQDTNASARAIYKYTLKIFAFYGYKYKHDIPMQEFAKRAMYDLWLLHTNEFLIVTQIAQKACFSQHKVTEKELAFMYEFADSLVQAHYLRLPRYKQLLFRYWYHLN